MPRPTLKDLVKTICPPEQPYKCVPYGKCYDVSSYCSNTSRSVEPCFPRTVLDSPQNLFKLCTDALHGVSILPDPSCLMACKHIDDSQPVYTSHQNSITTMETPELQPHPQIVVMVLLLTIWCLLGCIIGTTFLIYRHYLGLSAGTKSLRSRRFFIRKQEQTSRRIDEYLADNIMNEDQEELIELQLRTNYDPANIPQGASVKLLSEKSAPTEVPQLEEGNECKDVKIRETQGLKRRQSTTSNNIDVHKDSGPSESGNSVDSSSYEKNLVDEVATHQENVTDAKISQAYHVTFE